MSASSRRRASHEKVVDGVQTDRNTSNHRGEEKADDKEDADNDQEDDDTAGEVRNA